MILKPIINEWAIQPLQNRAIRRQLNPYRKRRIHQIMPINRHNPILPKAQIHPIIHRNRILPKVRMHPTIHRNRILPKDRMHPIIQRNRIHRPNRRQRPKSRFHRSTNRAFRRSIISRLRLYSIASSCPFHRWQGV